MTEDFKKGMHEFVKKHGIDEKNIVKINFSSKIFGSLIYFVYLCGRFNN